MSPQGSPTQRTASLFILVLGAGLGLAGAAGAAPPGVPLACPSPVHGAGADLLGFGVALGAALWWSRRLRAS